VFFALAKCRASRMSRRILGIRVGTLRKNVELRAATLRMH
jgi:hypothetical protein